MGKVKVVLVVLAIAGSALVGSLLARGPEIFASEAEETGVYLQFDSYAPEQSRVGWGEQRGTPEISNDPFSEVEPRPETLLDQIKERFGLSDTGP